jgi:hypothetical protein
MVSAPQESSARGEAPNSELKLRSRLVELAEGAPEHQASSRPGQLLH